ncbi:MAG: threonine/serine exporter family protein [Labilithrix sp.]|nr:threonine/serine exporter family protein [Labilithrix sp.]
MSVELADEPTPSARIRSREELADYLLEIGATLAACGCPSYRLEDVIRLIADVEGHRADPFALPTGLFLRVTARDGGGPQVQRMTRVSDWGVDLARLTLVDEVFNDVVDRRSTIEAARARIREIVARPPEFSPAIVFAATTAVSGASAVFFKGGALEVLVAAIVGAVIAGSRLALSTRVRGGALDPGVAAGTSRRNARRLLSDFFGGLFAASCAWLAIVLWPEARPEVIVPAGAIALFPGMTFTTGVAEVAQKNVVAGGARLIESAVTLLLILFGVALIAGLGEVVGVEMPSWLAKTSLPGLPIGWQVLALLVSSVGFGAVFQVPKRWLWTTFASSATGWIVADVALHFRLPGHVAAFCAALSVCMFANALARWTNRPAQLFQLPGMMLLVPGSFGFLSLSEFLETKDALMGTQRGFTMALVGAALVIGVLVANVLVPSRKLL